MNSEQEKTLAIVSTEGLNLLNLLAGLAFLFGSTLFLPQLSDHATYGVYLFMLGSGLMVIETLRAGLTR